MMKHTKKLLALVLSLILVFTVSATAFAAPGQDGKYLYGDAITNMNSANSSAYVVGTELDASATVTVVIEAGDCLDYNTYEIVKGSAFRKEITVTVTDTNSGDGIDGVTVAQPAGRGQQHKRTVLQH